MTTQKHQPSNSYISAEHLTELSQTSGIADDIIASNFRTLEPCTNPHDSGAEYMLDEVFCILIDDPTHNNNCTLSGSAQQTLANILGEGTCIFEGYKGKSVKPDSPRKGKQKKIINEDLKLEIEQKFIKYESVRGKGNQQVFIPHVTVRVAILIDSIIRYLVPENLRVAEYVPSSQDPSAIDDNFWDWFATTPYPLLITEGTKKVCSIVSSGFPAIGLNGVAGWSNGRDENGNRLPHQELSPFLGREIILAFDIDKSPKTVKSVNAEKLSFHNCIKDKNSKLTEIKWDSNHKGVDDWLGSMVEEKREVALSKACQNRSEVVSSKPNPNDKSSIKNSGNKDKPAAKPSNFTSLIETGLVEVIFNEKGESTNVPIGNHLEAIARVNNPEGTDATLLLEFKTYYGSISRWSMSRGFLGGDSRDITSELLRLGYHYERGQKQELLNYLHGLGSQVEQIYTVTDSSGWIKESFVLPHKTYGDKNLKFRDVEPSPNAMTEIKGTSDEWDQHIGSKGQFNSRITFVIGLPLAAPLLPLVGMESGGFHLVGSTSEGKSTLLKIANSVTGGKEIQSWRSTANGLEAIATAHNHILLPIDELGQADKSVGEAIYMLGNGQGKTRMDIRLANRKPKTWQLLFLSSGEISLGEYLAQAGANQKGGQEVRMPSIPAVPHGSPFGVFEAIHGCDDSKQFATNIEAACLKYHGTLMDAFLTRLIVDRADEKFCETLRSRVSEVSKKLAEGTKDHAVSRIASHFALTQVALELAHSYGLLSFSIENIEWSVNKMFTDWLNKRGGDGSIEIKQACEKIKHLLITNEFSDRVMDLRDGDTKTVRNMLACRKVNAEGDTEEFWMHPLVFDKECAVGVNKAELVKELQRCGWIKQPGANGRPTHERQIAKEKKSYFIFLPTVFQDSLKTMSNMSNLSNLAEMRSDINIQVRHSSTEEKNAMSNLSNHERENAGCSEKVANIKAENKVSDSELTESQVCNEDEHVALDEI
jgi:putative DNA primase/helicase